MSLTLREKRICLAGGEGVSKDVGMNRNEWWWFLSTVDEEQQQTKNCWIWSKNILNLCFVPFGKSLMYLLLNQSTTTTAIENENGEDFLKEKMKYWEKLRSTARTQTRTTLNEPWN